MNGIGNGIVRLLGFQANTGHSNVHSPEELEMLVMSSREAGLLQENEEVMLRRVFDFSDLQAREVMHPRTEVDAVAVDMPIPQLLKMISSLHYSRYPVYQGAVDTVIGLLNTKDLLDAVIKNPQIMSNPDGKFQLHSILRQPIFVPQTTTVDRVLDMMQKQKQQMVIVIDEYGGMAGIVTMEDILEEIVGEVQDEFDVETNPIETQGDVTLVDGLTTLTDIAERFGEVEGKTISTTIGGYVAERLDRIPTVGDTVMYGEYDLRVEEMDGLRASKLRFIRRVQEQNQPKQDSQPAATAST
jgi:putative hemolysin